MQRKRSNSWFQNALATVTRKASLGHEAIQEEDGDLVHEDLIPEGEKPSEAASSSSEAKPVDFQHPRTVVKYKAKQKVEPKSVYLEFGFEGITVLDSKSMAATKSFDYRQIKAFHARSFDSLFEFEYDQGESVELVSFKTNFAEEMRKAAIDFTYSLAALKKKDETS
eukprot:TRINITY_DN4741_c0_g1_i5.p1 TRINITY_DN4741_c0_g1~~TRINITY_DN4741_c0_g1_i5.p1  ORF type:complete len:167 (-),score=40.89 TRINITY_DN4741_c0_g1_i5:189-689(-)